MTDATYPARWYDADCRACPRLAGFLDAVAAEQPDYFCKPVPPFGPRRAPLLIVGLAPGKHGANATGRPFTGDYAGILLYRTLFDLDLATAPESHAADDALRLRGCRITNAVKCLPPENKPSTAEIRTCNTYLAAELADHDPQGAILALGKIAHDAVLRGFGLKLSAHAFGHANEHRLANGTTLIDSYHCSRYNTQTRRLTESMFQAVVKRARELAGL